MQVECVCSSIAGPGSTVGYGGILGQSTHSVDSQIRTAVDQIMYSMWQRTTCACSQGAKHQLERSKLAIMNSSPLSQAGSSSGHHVKLTLRVCGDKNWVMVDSQIEGELWACMNAPRWGTASCNIHKTTGIRLFPIKMAVLDWTEL